MPLPSSLLLPASFSSRSSRALAALAPLLVLFACATAPNPVRAADKLRIDFIDVGQGDAALVTSPTGKTVLIDGGPRGASRALVTFLATRTRGPLDLVLLTHRHEDHVGGLAAAVRQIGTRQFLDAPVPNSGPAYESLMRALDEKKVPARLAKRGRNIDLGSGAVLTLLGPPEPAIARSRENVNANSVVARLTYGRFALLLTGDAEAPTEAWLLGAGGELRSFVLKVAHHGSRYASGDPFLAAVGPRIAIVSAGRNNRYRHPAPETLTRLAAGGASIYRTDLDGDVTIETDGKWIDITARERHERLELP